MLEASMNAPPEKPFETRIADLVRRFDSDFEGEVIATWRALKRLLASRGVTFTDLGDAIEKLATGGLEEGAMKRIFDAGYQKAMEESERKHAEGQAVFGLLPDGSHDWEKIALYCQREKARIREAKTLEFIDDIASRLSWSGREPTEKQAQYLLSVFRKLGGRMS
jgi:hypothetical protein